MSDEYADQTGPCLACGQTLKVPSPATRPGPRTLAGCLQSPTLGDPAGHDLAARFGHLRQRSIWPFLLGGVCLFAVVNVMIGPLMELIGPNDPLAPLVYTCFGALGAQGALHAVWCVLAPVGFVKRLAVGVVTGLVLFGAWAVGLAVSGQFPTHSRWEFVRAGLLCLPLIAIAIQSPLWLARACFGWRLARGEDPIRQSGTGTFGIRDILIATAVLALALSAARLAVPDEVSSDDEFLLPLAIAALVVAGVSLLTTPPVVVATLRARRTWLALPVALLSEFIMVLGFGLVLRVIGGYLPPRQEYLGVAFTVGGFFACLAGALLVVRRFDYRLFWGRRKPEDGR